MEFPFFLDTRRAAAAPVVLAPVLQLRSFEEAVREAFSESPPTQAMSECPCRRIEIGHSEETLAGVQGCHNDRSFAGYPAGHLRIVRSSSRPGPIVGGVRLYVATVDVVLTGGRTDEGADRLLDFAMLPPAPLLVGVTMGESRPPRPTARNRFAGKGPVG
jgi:hypothetical protein